MSPHVTWQMLKIKMKMAKEESLIGNSLANGLRVGLQLADLVLYIQGEKSDHLKEISFSGKKKDKALHFQCESSENCELCIGFSTTYCSTD